MQSWKEIKPPYLDRFSCRGSRAPHPTRSLGGCTHAWSHDAILPSNIYTCITSWTVNYVSQSRGGIYMLYICTSVKGFIRSLCTTDRAPHTEVVVRREWMKFLIHVFIRPAKRWSSHIFTWRKIDISLLYFNIRAYFPTKWIACSSSTTLTCRCSSICDPIQIVRWPVQRDIYMFIHTYIYTVYEPGW